MNFSDYFDHISIISLKDRVDRRRRIHRELENIGLPLTAGKVEFFDAIRCSEAAGFPTAGYHGCFLSHVEVMRQAIKRDDRNVLILEDDVVFDPKFQAHEKAAIKALQTQPGWGIIQFGYMITEPLTNNGLQIPPKTVIGLHFYAVNKWVLPRLLQWYEDSLLRPAGHPLGGPMSPDGTLNHFRWANSDVPFFLYRPMLGKQSNSPSDLVGWRWFDHIPILGRCLRVVRDKFGKDV